MDDPLKLAQAAAAKLGGADWSVDESALDPDPAPGQAHSRGAEPDRESQPVDTPAPGQAHSREARAVAKLPLEKPAPPPRPAMLFPSTVQATETPPVPLRIVEAMLFVGGPPLTAEKVCSAVRGLTAEKVRELIDELTRAYRRQNRPYAIQPQGEGFVLAVKPQFRAIRERLYGGPKEARLSQPALDALSLIAYRQPITAADVEGVRGADSAGVVRQLVRLGLIAAVSRGGEGGTTYGTTPRFLELFGVASLDDLPKLGE